VLRRRCTLDQRLSLLGRTRLRHVFLFDLQPDQYATTAPFIIFTKAGRETRRADIMHQPPGLQVSAGYGENALAVNARRVGQGTLVMTLCQMEPLSSSWRERSIQAQAAVAPSLTRTKCRE
jgi:hypothetical protein